VRTATESPEAVVANYEEFKRNCKPQGETETTEVQCSHQRICFVPMVLEAHSGGWGKTARQALDVIAKSVAASTSDNAELSSLKIAQRLSTTL